MTLIIHVISAEWITFFVWLGWRFRGLALRPLWRQIALDGHEYE